MMKRKFFAIVLSALMAMSLVACGDKDATASTQEQPKTETTLAATNTVAETPKVETEKPKEEVTKESTEEASTEATVEETKPEETKPEEPKTETTTQAGSSATASTESTNVEAQTTNSANDNTANSATVASGKFNVDQFAEKTGALEFMMSDKQVLFLYDNVWFVEISSDIQNASQGSLNVGKWETDRQDRWNIGYFSCIFDFNEKVQVTSADYPEYTWYVSKSALSYLEATVNALKANPQFDTAPNVPGVTFKPCDYNDPFVQH